MGQPSQVRKTTGSSVVLRYNRPMVSPKVESNHYPQQRLPHDPLCYGDKKIVHKRLSNQPTEQALQLMIILADWSGIVGLRPDVKLLSAA